MFTGSPSFLPHEQGPDIPPPLQILNYIHETQKRRRTSRPYSSHIQAAKTQPRHSILKHTGSKFLTIKTQAPHPEFRSGPNTSSTSVTNSSNPVYAWRWAQAEIENRIQTIIIESFNEYTCIVPLSSFIFISFSLYFGGVGWVFGSRLAI